MGTTKEILLSVFAKLLVIPLASCFLINLNFLLFHTEHFDKNIGFLFFCLCSPWVLTLCFLYTLQKIW